MANFTDFDWPVFELNAIELLGHAKNNIVEAKEKAPELSQEYLDKLSFAYSLLNEVQECLFKK